MIRPRRPASGDPRRGSRRDSKRQPHPRPERPALAEARRRMPEQLAKQCQRPARRRVPAARRPAGRSNRGSAAIPASPPPAPQTRPGYGRRLRLPVSCGSAGIPCRRTTPALHRQELPSHIADKHDSPRITSPKIERTKKIAQIHRQRKRSSGQGKFHAAPYGVDAVGQNAYAVAQAPDARVPAASRYDGMIALAVDAALARLLL